MVPRLKLWTWSGSLDDLSDAKLAIDPTKDILVHRMRISINEATDAFFIRLYVFRTSGERLSGVTVAGNWQYMRNAQFPDSFLLPKHNPRFNISEYPDTSVVVLVEAEFEELE